MTDYIKAYEDPVSPYHREAVQLAQNAIHTDRVSTHNGIVRWTSNGQVPPQEILDLWVHLGFQFDVGACRAVQREEQAAFLAEYRRARAGGPTDEERFEARAAHGPGVELVDVITGRGWTT